MIRMYEATGNEMIPCPCGDENCEVEVDTHWGLDHPFSITKVPDVCGSDPTRKLTALEKGKVIHLTMEKYERDQERQQGRDSYWDA